MDIMIMGKNPNYLGAYDLYDLNVSEITVTIKKFTEDDVVANGQTSKCAVMHFEESYKPMIINPTNKKVLAKLFHSKLSENLIGKKIIIHYEKVKAFGKIHDALRIKDELPKAAPVQVQKCELCEKSIAGAGKMNPVQMAAYTKSKYGKMLCADCATKEKEKIDNENN